MKKVRVKGTDSLFSKIPRWGELERVSLLKKIYPDLSDEEIEKMIQTDSVPRYNELLRLQMIRNLFRNQPDDLCLDEDDFLSPREVKRGGRYGFRNLSLLFGSGRKQKEKDVIIEDDEVGTVTWRDVGDIKRNIKGYIPLGF